MRETYRCRRLTFYTTLAMLLLASACASAPPQQETNLTNLVIAGDVNAIKKFYANQEQLNERDAQGLYPLHYAVQRGDVQVAEILMVLGAKPDFPDPAGKTPLRYAIDRNQPAMATMLVGRQANPFIADASGATPAEAALTAGPDMLKAVFNANNINASGQDGRTVLHMASDKLLANEVGVLLDLGASVQAKDRADRTALDLALLYPDRKEAAVIAEKLIKANASPSFPEFAWFATTVRSTDFNTVRFGNGNTPLHEAVTRGQYGFVDFLLSRGLTPNIKNVAGDAPLHNAINMGWKDGAELLLKNNADPNITDGKSNTPLHLASSTKSPLEMTRLLIKFKADPSQKDLEGNTALHKAVKQKAYEPLIVEELIKAGTPVNSANLEGDTPLMICVKAGNYQYADALITAGSDVFLLNQAGESPLSIAVSRGKDAVDKIVLQSNVNNHDNVGTSVLATAVGMKGSPEVIALILSKGGDPNIRNNSQDNALHVAVRLNLAQQGLLLLNAKADIFASNATKDTPVFLALAAKDGPYEWFFIPSVITARDSNGDTVGHLAARRDLADGLDYLRNKGADLEAVNAAKETLLHASVKTDAAEATRYLIANGANLAARDGNGDAPLNTAVLSNAKTCLPVLVLSGVDLNARNFAGEAAIHQAVRKRNGEFVSYLVDRGALLEVRDKSGFTPLATAAREGQTQIAQYLIKSGAFIDARDDEGSTPLYQAVGMGQLDLIRSLVQAKADILAKNAAGDSPLLSSIKKGLGVVQEILGNSTKDKADSEGKTPLRHLVQARAPMDMLKLALSAGADPSSRDRFADTPLHIAILQKDLDTTSLLLSLGADPFAVNAKSESPISLVLVENSESSLRNFVSAAGLEAKDKMGEGFLHYAVRKAKADAVKLLLSMGANKDAKNNAGESAYDVAKAKDQNSILSVFGG